MIQIEVMEDRTLLASSPIVVGALGDSVTDEYQFYAPYRTAAQNWVEILSGLRPTQVSFGAFSTTTRGETRNQGYAQDWARSGAAAVGTDVAGAGTTFANQYNGGDPAGAPGLLTQPGGLSNVNVVTMLIGGNDYEQSLINTIDYTIQSGDVGESLGYVIGKEVLGALDGIPIDVVTGVGTAIQAIQTQDKNIPIVLISTPNVADTPLVIDANATLNSFLPAADQNMLVNALNSISASITSSLSQLATGFGVKFVDLDSLFSNFVADPVINGTYIDPTGAGPNYNDLFVGDGFHPGTVGQALLANAIAGQIDAYFPGAITPLTNTEILAYAKSVQPVTTAVLTASAGSTTVGAPVTFTVHVNSFPNINSTTTSVNFGTVPPRGTVTFIDTAQGNAVVGIEPLVPAGPGPTYTGSIATLTTSSLGPGVHQIVAIYNGDSVYPSASTGTSLEYVGTPKQVKLFSFVTLFQSQLGVQITAPQLNLWNKRLTSGAPPQHVARSIMRYVYFHTTLPRGQKAALLNRIREADPTIGSL